MASQVEFTWFKYHCFSVSEHSISMEALHKFYFINYLLKNKVNIYFCEINTLISCMVTANMDMEKWTPSMKKFLHFFLF